MLPCIVLFLESIHTVQQHHSNHWQVKWMTQILSLQGTKQGVGYTALDSKWTDVDVLDAEKIDKHKDLSDSDKGQIVVDWRLGQFISKTAGLVGYAVVSKVTQGWTTSNKVIGTQVSLMRDQNMSGLITQKNYCITNCWKFCAGCDRHVSEHTDWLTNFATNTSTHMHSASYRGLLFS